jgi:hypothetical protein
MKNESRVERLISEQWPKIRKRAQNENDLDRLTAIVEDIDDLLSILEMRVLGLTQGTRIQRSKEFKSDLQERDGVVANGEIGKSGANEWICVTVTTQSAASRQPLNKA